MPRSSTGPPQPTVALSPLDVRFAPGRIVQPDAMVLLNALPDDIAARATFMKQRACRPRWSGRSPIVTNCYFRCARLIRLAPAPCVKRTM